MHKVPIFSAPIVTSLIVFLAIISVFSILSFLCGSHKPTRHEKGKTEQLGKKRDIARLQSNISGKALLLSKLISWKKVDGGRGHYEEDDEAIWKKTIIKGDKCRPLNFSGKILYDADGNQIPDSPNQLEPTRSLSWKQVQEGQDNLGTGLMRLNQTKTHSCEYPFMSFFTSTKL